MFAIPLETRSDDTSSDPDHRSYQRPTYAALADAEASLIDLEHQIAERRAQQVAILGWLDTVHTTRIQGTRTINEWATSRLDIDPATARDLITAVRATGPTARRVVDEVADGRTSFARAVATLRLVDAGAGAEQVAASRDLDLGGVKRQTAALRKVTPVDEKRLLEQRHLRLTPTLGDTALHLTALAPGLDGHTIERALEHRLDQLPAALCGETRDQRRIDALSALARDYLEHIPPCDEEDMDGVEQRWTGGKSPGVSPNVTVFYDLDHDTGNGGVLGGGVAAGPRIGPTTLERILCEGTVSIVGMDGERPVTTTGRTRAIPPAVRDAVLRRDGGCVADGCTSRHRLQPHHIIERRHGGTNHPDNLVTLCWYHHHVVIHGYGKRLDPSSPPRRRRFLSPGQPDPPDWPSNTAPP